MKDISPVAFAALVAMLGMPEGTTQSEVEDRLLADAAARQNSFDNAGKATKNEVEAFAAEITALKATNADLESQVAALTESNASGEDSRQALADAQAEVETLNNTVSDLNQEIAELKAENEALKEKPSTSQTSTPDTSRSNRGKSGLHLID